MPDLHISTEEELTGLPDSKVCTDCNTKKNKDAFGVKKITNNKHTYWAFRSACRKCEAKRRRNQSNRAAERRILAQIAPMSAAKKLLEQNPEALALLVQRFRVEYVQLLEQERSRLLNIKRGRETKMQEVKGKYED